MVSFFSMRARALLSSLAAAPLIAGCSGTQATQLDTAPSDAGDETPLDFGAPSTTYPAFRPPVPQVVSAGGPVMTTVHIEPVFFPGDTLEPTLLDFLHKLAASPEWSQVVGEYGAGVANVLPPVEIPDLAPAKTSDDEIKQWLASQLTGTPISSQFWGVYDATTLPNTIYVLFYPASTTIEVGGGKACVDLAGYHNDTTVKDGTAIYAVIPRCSTSMNELGSVTSHELIEVATDPLWGNKPAFSDVDALDEVWAYFLYGGEIGDMCQILPTSSYIPPAVGYTIQRGWSNASAAGYHDPCVPIPAGYGAYFNAAAVLPDMVHTTHNERTLRGVNIKLGESRTIEVQLFSDAPTDGPWKVHAYDVALFKHQPSVMKLSLDRDSGQNGEKLHLTITPTTIPGNNVAIFLLDSHLSGRDAVWVGAVGVSQ
jgi:hypothetical protein